jgi:hypothetical protein
MRLLIEYHGRGYPQNNTIINDPVFILRLCVKGHKILVRELWFGK